MDLYLLGRTLHVSVGVVTLTTFWIAALARKGGVVHRRAGAVYLVSLIAILLTSVVMLAGRLAAGDSSTAAFIGILIIFIGTSAWLAWSSVRSKERIERLTGPLYRLLASLNIAAGLLLIWVYLTTRGAPLFLILSSVGIVMGTAMWRLILRGPRDQRWWLEQHMNAAAVNFAATHDSFLSLAVGSVIPVLREPWPRATIAVSVLSLALALRIWLGRRYLRSSRSDRPAEPVMLAG